MWWYKISTFLQQLNSTAGSILTILQDMQKQSKQVSLSFGQPIFYSKSTGKVLSMADFSLPSDQTVMIPLVFKDMSGNLAPPSGGTATTSDPTIATVVLSADGSSVTVTPVADGVGVTITATNGSLTATLLVDVVIPTPSSEAFNTANAVFSPLVAAPTPAPTPTPTPTPTPAPGP